MKRYSLILAAFLTYVCLASPAFSQVESFAVGGGFVIPSGDLTNSANAGFGGTVRLFYNYKDLKNIQLTGTLGYMQFGAKEENYYGAYPVEYRWTLIPIMTGGRYYFTTDENASKRFYIGGEVGYHIYSLSVKTPYGSGTWAGTLSSTNEFALQPMFGVEMGPLDAYAQLTIAGYNYIGLTASYKFNLKK